MLFYPLKTELPPKTWAPRRRHSLSVTSHSSNITGALTGAHFHKMWSMLWIDNTLSYFVSSPIRDVDLTGYPLSPAKSLWLRICSVAQAAWNLHPDNHPHTAGELELGHIVFDALLLYATIDSLCLGSVSSFAKRLKLAGQTKGRLSCYMPRHSSVSH